MAFSIPLTGLAANDPVPGVYIEIAFAQGVASLGTATYAMLILANRTTAGSATADTVIYGPQATSPVPLNQESDVTALFGSGSEGHRMWRRAIRVNQNVPLYMVAVTESVGANATLAITLATAATANGTLRLYMGDEFVDTAITSGDTAIAIAGNVAASVNTMQNWAVTAANSGTAVVTLTAKNKGLRGNWLRGSAVVMGSGVGTTSSVTAQTFFTGGTTADSNVTALATIATQRFYYIVSSAEDSTQFGAVATQVGTQALPTSGIRQRCFAGSVDTEANAQTVAVAVNNARAEIVWLQQGDWTPGELAANIAAIYAVGEAPGVNGMLCNWDNLGLGSDSIDSLWFVPPPRSGIIPSRTTIKAALNNGITPIGTTIQGKTYLVMRATTRSLTNAINDYRIRDGCKVTICDFYADDLNAKTLLQFSKCVLISDPVPGQRTPQPQSGKKAVTPSIIKAAINKLTREYGDSNLLVNIPQIIADTIVIQESNPKTRASAKVPLQTVDPLHQIAYSLDQVN